MADVRKIIEVKIGSKKVMVFSKRGCPYCSMAKQVFQEYLRKGELSEDDYEVMEIDAHPDMRSLQTELRAMTGASSVPRVFIKGKCIGGGDETSAAHRSGKLKTLLAA